MSDSTRSNASPAPENCDSEKYAYPFPCSLDPRDLCSFPHPHNEPAKRNYNETSTFVNKDSQVSDDVIEESAAAKLSTCEALIRENRCKNTSYLNHVVPEQIHEFDHANLLIESAEQECEPVKRDALTTSVNRESVVFSINMNQDHLAQALELPLDDENENSQVGVNRFDDDESCFTGMTRKQLKELPELHYRQIESERNQPEENNSVVSSHCESDQFQSISENMVVEFSNEGLKLHSEDTKQIKVLQTIMQTQEDVSEGLSRKLLEKNHFIDSELVQNNSAVVDNSQEVDPHVSNCFLDDALKLPLVNASNSCKQSKSLIEDLLQNSRIEELETPVRKAAKHSKQVSCQASKSRRKRYILRSLGHTDRVLRSRTRGNATTPKPTNHVSSVRNRRDGKGRKKNRRKEVQVSDEFSKIRKCLRYLLHRMTYEQSFIAAYSGEGWKGYSLEKLKPEKELQRATNEIMQRKLKIRDLFKHLDSLCVEGRFSESLFDSEGQIDSEDIFCAKCGSKEMSTTDDIILCDGACDRGFHQFCLEPPLLNEDIPPDDEGWLCPGCDCKVDCIDLLNDSQGTNYSITDSWENVYPEAAAVAGHNNDQNFGLPSDDSDDNDFDPDGQETDDQGDESSSDVSESNSESEKLEASPKDHQYVGLPSDDSDDGDYNPGAPDTEENINSESSSSDFTSDSENLAAILEDDRPSRIENDSVSSALDSSNFPRGIDKRGRKKGLQKHSLNDELLSILELGPINDGVSPIVSRRHVERLDYKKLHDETYGNVSSDSSDDEYWTDIAAKRKKNCGLVSPAQQNGKSSVVKKEETHGIFFSDSSDDKDLTDIAAKGKKNCGLVSPASKNGKSSVVKKEDNVMGEHDVKGSGITPRKSARRRKTVEDTNDSLIKAQEGSSKPGSTGGRAKSTFSKLGEAVVQRLLKSFEENQYPDKHAKETLAKDLGLNFKQVSKWFENTRWSTRHPSHVKATTNASIDESESSLQKGSLMSHSTIKPEAELDTRHRGGTRSSSHLIKSSRDSDVPPRESEDTKDGISGSHKTTGREPNSIRSRKRKGRSDHTAVNTNASIMEKQKPLAGSSKAHEGQASGHIRTRRQTFIAANTDGAQKSLVESSKASVNQENHRIRTRRQKLIA